MHGKFGLLSPGKASSHSTALPSVFSPVCSVFVFPESTDFGHRVMLLPTLKPLCSASDRIEFYFSWKAPRRCQYLASHNRAASSAAKEGKVNSRSQVSAKSLHLRKKAFLLGHFLLAATPWKGFSAWKVCGACKERSERVKSGKCRRRKRWMWVIDHAVDKTPQLKGRTVMAFRNSHAFNGVYFGIHFYAFFVFYCPIYFV